ncbi:hypothetical protein N9D63_01340 [Opitutales bacterium]|jgi:hypothetical protein|nr:hypothetical protein [Opitutales bacterium]
MKKLTTKILLLATTASILNAHEGPWTAGRPDGHAPITVMGEHMHAMGEWMLSYRFMSMDMEGLLKGSDNVSTNSMLTKNGGDYAMLPEKMSMNMHMLGTMYAVSDKWTLMAMLNYLDNDMDMNMEMGAMKMVMKSSAESSGFGDIKFSGLYDLASWDNGQRVHFNVGISVPTGSIDEKASDGKILGYGMQLGSGTWDFLPAITFLGQTDNYSWGAQVGGALRMGDNDRGYSLGNRFDAILWGARKLTDSFSLSAKFDYATLGEIDGKDADIAARNMMMKSPGFDPASQGRDLSTFGLGLNYYCRNGTFKGHRLAVEWETPMSEDINGVQLETDSIWSLGWQYAW